MQEVHLTVTDVSGKTQDLVFPTGMGLSLMEALKGAGYPIEAVCGGDGTLRDMPGGLGRRRCFRPNRS